MRRSAPPNARASLTSDRSDCVLGTHGPVMRHVCVLQQLPVKTIFRYLFQRPRPPRSEFFLISSCYNWMVGVDFVNVLIWKDYIRQITGFDWCWNSFSAHCKVWILRNVCYSFAHLSRYVICITVFNPGEDSVFPLPGPVIACIVILEFAVQCTQRYFLCSISMVSKCWAVWCSNYCPVFAATTSEVLS